MMVVTFGETEGTTAMALFGKKMRDPVPGTARVIDNDRLRSIPGQSIHCPLDLMVQADGVPAQMVHIKVRPPTGKWPEVNHVLPVMIDRSDPTHVEIVWDQVQSLQDRLTASRAQRLDAAAQSVASGTAPAGSGPFADLARQAMADPAAFAERMRAQGTPVGGMRPPAAAPGLMDRIAQLADLRDRGALTEQEFTAEKNRLFAQRPPADQ